MDCEENMLYNLQQIRSKNPSAITWLYRNGVKALPWFTSVRKLLEVWLALHSFHSTTRALTCLPEFCVLTESIVLGFLHAVRKLLFVTGCVCLRPKCDDKSVS
jgi:hypothetical protein